MDWMQTTYLTAVWFWAGLLVSEYMIARTSLLSDTLDDPVDYFVFYIVVASIWPLAVVGLVGYKLFPAARQVYKGLAYLFRGLLQIASIPANATGGWLQLKQAEFKIKQAQKQRAIFSNLLVVTFNHIGIGVPDICRIGHEEGWCCFVSLSALRSGPRKAKQVLLRPSSLSLEVVDHHESPRFCRSTEPIPGISLRLFIQALPRFMKGRNISKTPPVRATQVHGLCYAPGETSKTVEQAFNS